MQAVAPVLIGKSVKERPRYILPAAVILPLETGTYNTWEIYHPDENNTIGILKMGTFDLEIRVLVSS